MMDLGFMKLKRLMVGKIISADTTGNKINILLARGRGRGHFFYLNFCSKIWEIVIFGAKMTCS